MSNAPICTPWCVDGDGHPREAFRADQWCQGEVIKVLASLEKHAPALPVTVLDASEPGISVYARRDPNSLPYIVINMYREGHNENLCVDADMKLAVADAIELAVNLISAVETIAGAK